MKKMVGLALATSLGCSIQEGFSLLKKHGFDATFTDVSNDEELDLWANEAAKHGIFYSSLHAPFDRAHLLWENGINGDDAEKELIESIDACARINVPILVMHPFIGFQPHEPNETGLTRFRHFAEHADRRGIKIALENVEGEEHLHYLLKGLDDFSSVGFCLDSGHELCYNGGKDLLAIHGSRLIYTHINSNMGVTSPDGSITWHDDAHMLPFDGKVNMESLAKRLKACDYQGVLMLELVKGNRPNRSTNDAYTKLSTDEYLAKAAQRIKKLRDMIE